jgi:radical SAM superfamily enzyme YgiQ (UPF0313 family)
MKVLLANAPTRIPVDGTNGGRELFYVKAGSRWPFSIDKAPSEAARYVPFPFSMAYLAALLEKASIPVDVIDAVALNMPEDEFLARAAKSAPTLIVMEATTPTIQADLALAGRLKGATGATIALTGAHTTVFPKETLGTTQAVDWILTGEYEMNALEAILAEAAGGPDKETRLAAVRELVRALPATEGDERSARGGPARRADPQSRRAAASGAAPLPDSREAPSMWSYWDGFCQRRPAVQMHASRGCPFKCTFSVSGSRSSTTRDRTACSRPSASSTRWKRS